MDASKSSYNLEILTQGISTGTPTPVSKKEVLESTVPDTIRVQQKHSMQNQSAGLSVESTSKMYKTSTGNFPVYNADQDVSDDLRGHQLSVEPIAPAQFSRTLIQLHQVSKLDRRIQELFTEIKNKKEFLNQNKKTLDNIYYGTCLRWEELISPTEEQEIFDINDQMSDVLLQIKNIKNEITEIKDRIEKIMTEIQGRWETSEKFHKKQTN